MNAKEAKEFTQHCSKHFQQEECTILQPLTHQDFRLNALLYEPNDAYPFWKMVTLGAGDYEMPGQNELGKRNEYVMFIAADEDLKDQKTVLWYYNQLLSVPYFVQKNRTMLTYGHSLDWGPREGSDKAGVYLELPMCMDDVDFLRCRLESGEERVILQVVLITKEELAYLKEVGPEEFDRYIYPMNGGVPRFLCEKNTRDIFE